MNKTCWTYTLITYFITWTISLGSYFMYKAGSISYDTLALVFNFGALGPFIGAIVSAKLYYGNKGVATLFSTFRFGSVNKASLLISLSPIVFFILACLLYPLLSGHWYSFNDTQRQFKLSTTITYVSWSLPFITYAIFEEFGWRGFLLPHLQAKYNALKATTVLTIIWASWHLPFFLWRFQFSPFIAFGFFFSIFVGAVLLTSTFNFSKGSIVATILFHLTNNIMSALDKEYIVAVLSTGFVFLAIYIIRKYKPENLCNGIRVMNIYTTDNI